ncbi:hypothetical protein BDM02DRAFT_3142078, partial [Thelephora ganbajun]
RIADAAKTFLDIAKESADWFPPLQSALYGVIALIKRYEQFEGVKDKIKDLKPQLDRFKQHITTTTIGGDPGETERRKELTKYAHQLVTTPTLFNGLRSALEEIERRSRELLEGTVIRFVNRGDDSGEVAKLVERLREAITRYQIPQQRAIYGQIPNLASSFDTILKLLEVTHFSKLVTTLADAWTEITGGEKQAGFRNG